MINTKNISKHSLIERTDCITLKGATVVAGMTVQNEDLNLFTEQKHSPQTIEIDNIRSMGSVKVRWIVSGNANGATIAVSGTKGGFVSEKVGKYKAMNYTN
jgi:hypothetical protein